jgi:hypothetical protein
MKARGRDLIAGLPKTFEVSNKDMEVPFMIHGAYKDAFKIHV